MKKAILLLLICLFIEGEALAGERYILKFELPIAANKIEKGMLIVSPKAFTWSHGLKRSYLSLKCETLKSGKLRKIYTPEEHFTGLKVAHKLVAQNIELTLTYSAGTPRLKEIRQLPADKCQEITPNITTVKETYRFPAENGLNQYFPFGKSMKLHIKLQTMGRTKTSHKDT